MPLSLVATGIWNNNGISGSKVLAKKEAKKEGELSKTLTTEWKFKVKDYCRDVWDMVYQDLAWAEAYNDPDLRSTAKMTAITKS